VFAAGVGPFSERAWATATFQCHLFVSSGLERLQTPKAVEFWGKPGTTKGYVTENNSSNIILFGACIGSNLIDI
jgi:hypothetical protein